MASKNAKSVLVKYARARGRNQGQCCGRSYGSSISMVLRCGRKPSGEEVSVSLVYALGLRTDQTIVPPTEYIALAMYVIVPAKISVRPKPCATNCIVPPTECATKCVTTVMFLTDAFRLGGAIIHDNIMFISYDTRSTIHVL